MERMIPLEKMSKKAKRAYYAARRGTWGAISPVTRAPAKPGAYKRKKYAGFFIDCSAIYKNWPSAPRSAWGRLIKLHRSQSTVFDLLLDFVRS